MKKIGASQSLLGNKNKMTSLFSVFYHTGSNSELFKKLFKFLVEGKENDFLFSLSELILNPTYLYKTRRFKEMKCYLGEDYKNASYNKYDVKKEAIIALLEKKGLRIEKSVLEDMWAINISSTKNFVSQIIQHSITLNYQITKQSAKKAA